MKDKIENLAAKLASQLGHPVGEYHRFWAAERVREILANDNRAVAKVAA